MDAPGGVHIRAEFCLTPWPVCALEPAVREPLFYVIIRTSVDILSRPGARGRGGLIRRFGDSLWVARESDSGELPAFFRLEEIAIALANVSA